MGICSCQSLIWVGYFGPFKAELVHYCSSYWDLFTKGPVEANLCTKLLVYVFPAELGERHRAWKSSRLALIVQTLLLVSVGSMCEGWSHSHMSCLHTVSCFFNLRPRVCLARPPCSVAPDLSLRSMRVHSYWVSLRHVSGRERHSSLHSLIINPAGLAVFVYISWTWASPVRSLLSEGMR